MKIDSSFTIAGIIAVVALISPSITAIVNNRYDLKKRKIETYYSKQCQALDDFVKATLDYYGESLTWGEMTNYTSALNNLYIYFEKIDDSLLSQLDEYRKNKQLSDYKETLNFLVKQLSKQIIRI